MSFMRLQDMVIAELLTDTATGTTYGTPIEFPGITRVTFTPQYDTQNVYGDNTVMEVNQVLTQVEAEFGLTHLTLAQHAKLQGKRVGASGAKYGGNPNAPYFAVGFKAGASQDAGGGERYVWLYKGKFNPIEHEYATSGDSAESIQANLSGVFLKRKSDDEWSVMIETDEEGVDETAIDTFFDGVFKEPVTP